MDKKNQLELLFERKKKSDCLPKDDLNGKYKKAYENLIVQIRTAAADYVTDTVMINLSIKPNRVEYVRKYWAEFSNSDEYKNIVKLIQESAADGNIEQVENYALKLRHMLTMMFEKV